MISLKKHIITHILLLIGLDIIIIIFAMQGFRSFGFFLLPQALVTIIHYDIAKSKLYNLIKSERKEILKKYKFMVKHSSWEWNIIIAAHKTQDPLLKEIRNKVIIIYMSSHLLIVNIIIMFHIMGRI